MQLINFPFCDMIRKISLLWARLANQGRLLSITCIYCNWSFVVCKSVESPLQSQLYFRLNTLVYAIHTDVVQSVRCTPTHVSNATDFYCINCIVFCFFGHLLFFENCSHGWRSRFVEESYCYWHCKERWTRISIPHNQLRKIPFWCFR